MGDLRATGNTGKGNPGTVGRASPDARGASAAMPLGFKVSVYGWREGLLDRLKRAVGVAPRTERNAQSPADAFAEYDDFFSRVSSCIKDFSGRTGGKTVTVYFTPPTGMNWADVRRTPRFLYTHVLVRNELQLDDERRAEAHRNEEELREIQEERRATAERLEADATRERARQRAAPKVKELARAVVVRTMYWTSGQAHALYANGDFTTIYSPIAFHQIPDRAMRHVGSPDTYSRIEDALWDAFWQQGRWQKIYEIGAPPPVVQSLAHQAAPQAPVTAVTDDCDALFKAGRHEEWIKCMQRQRLAVAEDMRTGAMTVTEPAAAVLEAANPFDPLNLAMLPIGGITSRAVGAVVAAIRRRRGFRVLATFRRGAPYRILGDATEYQASLRGHHVYQYISAEGELLYVGKSGGVQGLSRVDWVGRLSADHRYTERAGGAKLVRVSSDLTEQEMWALEETLIPTARYNIQPGEYSRRFRGGDLSANAASAQRQPQFMFIIDTDLLNP